MSWLNGNYEITAEQSAAYNAAKGAAGEQPPEIDDDDLEPPVDCACTGEFLYGVDPQCPACDGTGRVDEPNVWCDACGMTGACMDCDPDTYRDRQMDR